MRTRLSSLLAVLAVVLVAVLSPSTAWAGTGNGNNGTVKIDGADVEASKDNDPHVGCAFNVEWYNFDKGSDIVSTVTFEMQSPTGDVALSVDGDSRKFVGADAAGGGQDLDGVEKYTLSFYGAPHPQQGYHVKMTTSTPGSNGTDTKSKVFWVTGCAQAAPAMTLTKTVADSDDADSIGSLGETLTYAFSVTNTGNVPLTNVKVLDAQIPSLRTATTCATTLAVGATASCNFPDATHVVTDNDIARGSVVNTATGSANPPLGSPLSTTASATISTPATPALKLTKTVRDSDDADTIGSLGETLTYTFSVTNTGNVPLTNVVVTDKKIPALANGATCLGSLAVGATSTCTSLPAATHVVTADDVANGSVPNTASATATPGNGAAPSTTASATIASPAAPAITMTKSVRDSDDADTVASEGETLTYSFTVKNTGNVPLTNVTVKDAMIPALASGALCVSSLAVGETTTCPSLPAATHVTTGPEAASGILVNTATSSATPPSGSPVTAAAQASIGTRPSAPSISLTKSVRDSDDADAIGSLNEVLTYSFTVRNTGNVPLTNVKITDPMIPALKNGGLCAANLAVGATTSCPQLAVATHTVTADDIAAGSVDNTATGSAAPPSGAAVTSTATATISTPALPALRMTKTVKDSNDVDSIGSLGEVLTYTFRITNTGNAPLSNVTLTDPMIPALKDGVVCATTLAVNASTTCSGVAAQHTVNADDIARGSVDNTATGSGTGPRGQAVSTTATATIATPANPAISMTKVVADSDDADSLASEDEVLTYTFTVTNTGNVPLTDVVVTDPMIPALAGGGACVATLAVGATTSCPALPTATHRVTAEEVTHRTLTNTATTTATPPTGDKVTSSATATIGTMKTPVTHPSIRLDKDVADSPDADSLASEGETLTYSFTVTNTGDVPLTDVRITDNLIPALAGGAACVASLAAGETTTCPALPATTYVTSASDVANGAVVNTATVTGNPAKGSPVTSTDSVTIPTKSSTPPPPGTAAMKMTKSVADSDDADNLAAAGEQLTYSFTVTNTGDVALSNVRVTDAMIPALKNGALCVASLPAGETTRCPELPVATYLTTAGDVGSGSVVNHATSTATPATGSPVTAAAQASIGTFSPDSGDPTHFNWDWRYDDPSCTALTVTYPSDLPDNQANDVNVRIVTDTGEFTLNFHDNEGFFNDNGNTHSFDYLSHPGWPAGTTSYRVVWTQVAGTNYHWTGSVPCRINSDGDPTTDDQVQAVTQITGWRTSTVTIGRGSAPSADTVDLAQADGAPVVLQRLVSGRWTSVTTVTTDATDARVTFPKLTRAGTYKFRLAVPETQDITGATTGAFTVRVR
ncbi:DUF11 domain-containing protein [Nocardioides sp. LS1]|uniref:DUF7507 domain-containing protein n=1 Tax=Nocardioides sp. LS1 TaxID=1027620 RepID=UPI000F61B4D8|nr:DUF11 domain-containing protein [Nocardioides sp. LS1]GCD90911.1 hypothetical protein NLS1_29170 [Nocardioides sp. LS1]